VNELSWCTASLRIEAAEFRDFGIILDGRWIGFRLKFGSILILKQS